MLNQLAVTSSHPLSAWHWINTEDAKGKQNTLGRQTVSTVARPTKQGHWVLWMHHRGLNMTETYSASLEDEMS